ncbi:hypothetical protein [Streptomyces sp. NBC_01465]|uniref:hypothetical protein n=1 Tax=Streptomyces sp. NBC_01465 TaxID=2903878 RepID=UPI002E365026|nr:hypothetical protein [Streptomyces sp. NBC_01465]
MVVLLCALAVPLWFAKVNGQRYLEGHPTKTLGYVHCESDGPCRGTWQLPGTELGQGEIDGLNFEADEELITNIPIYAGRDWAVVDRTNLIGVAVTEAVLAVIGISVVLFGARLRAQ